MIRKAAGVACGAMLALAMLFVAPTARATELDQASQLTFSRPVVLPGQIVLPAGTYWFELADPLNAPNLIRVYNLDHSKLITTMMTIPAIRNQRADHSVLTFAEQSKNRPYVLEDWYYVDRITGHQLIYSQPMENRLNEERQVTVIAKSVPEITEAPNGKVVARNDLQVKLP